MEILSHGSFEKRLQDWASQPWKVLQRTFKGLTLITFLAGTSGLLWSFKSERSEVQVVRTRDASANKSRSWSYYSSVILKHDLFKLAPPPVVVKAAPPAPPPKPTLAELAADLTLVGVLDNGAQAAILSRKSNETLYLSVGQQIAGITIAAIEGNRVKLAYDGQTLDLSE